MGKVNVVIVDATGNKEQKVGLPDDIKCGIIMVKLVEKIKLPSVGPDGNPISYKFIHKVTGRQLLEAQTLGEAGIKDGDVLRLQPEITAGAVCPHCGNAISDGATFCSACGTSLTIQNFTPVVPVVAAPPKETKSFPIVLVLGLIAAGLVFISNMVLQCAGISLSYDEDVYIAFTFFKNTGIACFMADIAIYMFNRLKK